MAESNGGHRTLTDRPPEMSKGEGFEPGSTNGRDYCQFARWNPSQQAAPLLVREGSTPFFSEPAEEQFKSAPAPRSPPQVPSPFFTNHSPLKVGKVLNPKLPHVAALSFWDHCSGVGAQGTYVSIHPYTHLISPRTC
jgi:hypothetical protein